MQSAGSEREIKLLIGWASRDITPERPVALQGQFHVRISKRVNDPITATALAIESVDNNEQAIMVSCDIVGIDAGIQNRLRDIVKPQLPDLDTSEQGYWMARQAYEAAGRSVVDATIGGHLQVFPKVAYESLFQST